MQRGRSITSASPHCRAATETESFQRSFTRRMMRAGVCAVMLGMLMLIPAVVSAAPTPSVGVSISAVSISAATPSAAMPTLMAQTQPVYLPGAYLSWIKLLLVGVTFLFWVFTSDWLNKDAMKIGEKTKMTPEIWNPIVVGSFLFGFWCAISIPLFLVGYPLFLISTTLPFLLYFFSRRSKIKANPGLVNLIKGKPGEPPPPAPLPQDEGAEIEFAPAGKGPAAQSNLIRARQSGAYVEAKGMIDHALTCRADSVMLDYTQHQVNSQILVDGSWHALEPMDRVTGDAMLVSFKSLAGLDPMDRRSQQKGKFGTKSEKGKADVQVLSQGTQTGERVSLKLIRKKKDSLGLTQAGMFPEMATPLKDHMNTPGSFVIISAPKTQGLSTSWKAALMGCNRMSRDCVGVFAENHPDMNVENFTPNKFDPNLGQGPNTILRGILLTQPDVVAVPDLVNRETLDMLLTEANEQNRSIITMTQAGSAAEALLRVYQLAGDRKGFLSAIKAVTCQRLVRRLCEKCKQPVQVAPKLIQQLGGDPRTQNTLFNQYRQPPPEQMVDETGKPIEPPPPCETCAGMGYIGRIAVFEMLEINDHVRKAIAKTPKVSEIEKAARAQGKASLAAQGYKLVLLGLTSLHEMQRVMKNQS